MSDAATASYDQAVALFGEGDFEASREIALELLAGSPREPSLLRLAGKAGVELGLDDAVSMLEQATEADPDNADAWRDLADALLAEGRTADARTALERGVERRPDDAELLADLAHVVHASGETAEAIGQLERVLELDFNNLSALRGLVAMYRDAGRLEDALAAGRKVIAYRPSDVATAIDVADLTLALDRPEDAVDAFRWLRDVDDEPDHEVYAVHGMIEAEIRRERWRTALDLAIDVTRVDRFGRTTDILAYVVTQVFGASDRPAPSRRDVEDALAASRAEHRQLHATFDV
jgi:tetratricopeptide (TPR) repeat protein